MAPFSSDFFILRPISFFIANTDMLMSRLTDSEGEKKVERQAALDNEDRKVFWGEKKNPDGYEAMLVSAYSKYVTH